MKKLTIKELKKRKELFLDLFADGKSVIAQEFDISLEQLENKHFVYAYYYDEDYLGDAYILFIENDKIYEVDAHHCSCYGLEGQFEPEEVPIEVLYHRIENNNWKSGHLKNILVLPELDECDCDSYLKNITGEAQYAAEAMLKARKEIQDDTK